MAQDRSQLLRAVEAGLALQEVELAEARARQVLTVTTRAATGTGDIDQAFQLDQQYRLVFVRCHFSGAAGKAALAISVDSGRGAAYDTRLYTITRAGTSRDVNFRVSAEESQEPSPWAFQVGDAVLVEWTNPDSGNITWGLEVGLVIAS